MSYTRARQLVFVHTLPGHLSEPSHILYYKIVHLTHPRHQSGRLPLTVLGCRSRFLHAGPHSSLACAVGTLAALATLASIGTVTCSGSAVLARGAAGPPLLLSSLA